MLTISGSGRPLEPSRTATGNVSGSPSAPTQTAASSTRSQNGRGSLTGLQPGAFLRARSRRCRAPPERERLARRDERLRAQHGNGSPVRSVNADENQRQPRNALSAGATWDPGAQQGGATSRRGGGYLGASRLS